MGSAVTLSIEICGDSCWKELRAPAKSRIIEMPQQPTNDAMFVQLAFPRQMGRIGGNEVGSQVVDGTTETR